MSVSYLQRTTYFQGYNMWIFVSAVYQAVSSLSFGVTDPSAPEDDLLTVPRSHLINQARDSSLRILQLVSASSMKTVLYVSVPLYTPSSPPLCNCLWPRVLDTKHNCFMLAKFFKLPTCWKLEPCNESVCAMLRCFTFPFYTRWF